MVAKFGGAPGAAQVELTVQNTYFAFQVIQSFLVVTLASAATSVAKQIVDNPASVTSLLAENLPKASNFYINYFILQGLAISSKTLLRLIPLIITFILGKFLDKTPRKVYKRWATMSDIKWGSVMPQFAVLLVIGKPSFRALVMKGDARTLMRGFQLSRTRVLLRWFLVSPPLVST